MNDEEIIKLFEARDEKGISAAGERYGKLLRSVARGILRSEQDAEECESEARCAPGTRYLPPDRSACAPIFAG